MTKVFDHFPTLKGKDTDPRVRRYLTPTRIVHTTGDVENSHALLETRSSQITLDQGNACILKNGDTDRAQNASVLVDFGMEFHGSARIFVWFVKNEAARANLRIRFGESVMEAMSDIGIKNATNDHANRDMFMNVGMLSANETNPSGFRFMRVDLLDDNTEVSLKSLEGVFIYRDIEYKGSFSCNDEMLNTIWKTAAYTVHLNMQEYLWDGIKRDRLVWIGDMHTEVMSIQTVFGYNEVVPKSLDIIRDETPLGSWMNGISSYSIWWLLIHHDWFMYFGNMEYLNEQKEYITGLLEILSDLVDENGKETMPETRFIDWPNANNPIATGAGLQGMLIVALEKGGYLADVLGNNALAKKCADTVKKLRTYIPDPDGSKQAASFMVLGGLGDAKKINEDIISVDGAKGFSTFLGYYTLKAKALADDYQGALDAIRQYWGSMIKMGATTFWEDFNLDWMENATPITEIVPEGKVDIHGDYGAHCYVKFRHSLCHGWASGPAPWLSEHVLGVQITEKGCKAITIAPHLGDLTWAKGTYPTPYGNIEISHVKQDNGSIKTDYTAPKEIKITVIA